MRVQDRSLAIQRLTALWAFGECGLGGVMHGLQIPFTGLVVGAIAIICITMIGLFSEGKYSQLFKSLVIVLIVKAVVSPHTPFPAYIAVSFQALLAYTLFSLFSINWLSILLLSVIAMIESAVQKLLLLTLFFGKTFWASLDEFLLHITRPFQLSPEKGSWWLIGAYLFIYVIGGLYTAVLATRLIKSRGIADTTELTEQQDDDMAVYASRQKSRIPYFLVGGSLIFLLLVFYAGGEGGIVRSLAWTVFALLAWYVIVSPFLTRLVHKLLLRKTSNSYAQAGEIISFLPVMRRLTRTSWQASQNYSGIGRINQFLFILFGLVISYKAVDKSGT